MQLKPFAAVDIDTGPSIRGTDELMAAATEPASGSSQNSPRFLTLGDGNEVLQVALGPGDEVFATERSFVYRGLGLRQELHRTAERGALGRALGW